MLKHLSFLKEVLRYSLSAFGGPQGHYGMMMRSFVQKRKDLSEEELMDLLSFCQMLPGPSSSQTITLIGYKKGGVKLAVITLILWILPAATIMSALSFGVKAIDVNEHINIFQFIQPMAIGFILYAALRASKVSVKSRTGIYIVLFAILVTIFVRSPYIFPGLLLLGGFITNFTNKDYPAHNTSAYKIHWSRLAWFIGVFILAGILSELARTQHWQHARAFNLFENFYRFGSLVFGGGHALVPMMYDQFVVHADKVYGEVLISKGDFLSGAGLVNAIPGPVFTLCSYIGGMCLDDNPAMQILGCLIGTVGVFLPGSLLLFFLFPLYENLKQYRVIYRALEGVHAVIVGILWASAFVLFRDIFKGNEMAIGNIFVVLSTTATLYFSKIPSPIIVLFWLFMGYFF